MKILVADDDPVTQAMLQTNLTHWGHEVVLAADGLTALQTMLAAEAPRLAILDWIMPTLEGHEVCRSLRQQPNGQPPYLIILTGLKDKDSIVAGLEAGADDFITKPFDPLELRARINVGIRIVNLLQQQTDQILQLQQALAHVKLLQGILPICSRCKKVRNDKNYWQEVDRYFTDHSDLLFSHGFCPDCFEIEMAKIKKELGLE